MCPIIIIIIIIILIKHNSHTISRKNPQFYFILFYSSFDFFMILNYGFLL